MRGSEAPWVLQESFWEHLLTAGLEDGSALPRVGDSDLLELHPES